MHTIKIVFICVSIAAIAVSIPFAVLSCIYGTQEFKEKWKCVVLNIQYEHSDDPWIEKVIWNVSARNVKHNNTLGNCVIRKVFNLHIATYEPAEKQHPVWSTAPCIQSKTSATSFEWKMATSAGFYIVISLAYTLVGVGLVSVILVFASPEKWLTLP